MSSRWRTLLRYDWPLHFILMLTNWLPDNVIFFRFRGYLARPFLGVCGKNLRLGRNLTFYNPSRIYIGKNVYIALGCVFLADGRIWIDDEVIFGPYCVLASGSHTRVNGSFRFGDIVDSSIKIMRGSWLGAHVVITAGSCVGYGSLIAAGAVVAKNMPRDTLVGGVPARAIKNLSDGNK